MLLIWTDEAWDDYLYWQSQDKKTLKRINKITKTSNATARRTASARRNRYAETYPATGLVA